MTFPRGSGRSVISTSPRRASTADATSTTAGSRTSPPAGCGTAWPGWRRPPPPATGVDDPHDESHLAAFERRAQVAYGELELHRSNPLAHLAEMDLACYDREYAPAEERERAKLAHLALWPQAVDAALASLDQVSAPVASVADLGGIQGLAAGIPADAPPAVASAARAAHRRLVAHVERAARQGDPDPALGAAGLRSLMSAAEDIDVDLGALAERADAERDRLLNRLAEDCARIDASRPPLELCRDLVRDHPGPDGVIEAAQLGTDQAIEFTRERNLMPYNDGVCLVGPAPESRRWAMAMISTAAPGEPEAPSWFYVTPPEPSWPRAGAGGVAGGVQRHHAARHRRARGRAGALLARPRAAPGGRAGAPDPALRRVPGGLGALRRGVVRRGGIPRRRPPVRGRACGWKPWSG